MHITELSTKALLDIFAYLDVEDTINLAETCLRLQDVAQLRYEQYKVFNLYKFVAAQRSEPNRHNRIEVTKAMKAIGPYILELVADLNENFDRQHMGSIIQKYCVNVKSLKIIGRYRYRSRYLYSQWLVDLNLENVSIHSEDLFLINQTGIRTLKELAVRTRGCHLNDESARTLTNILARNSNINSLRIPWNDNVERRIENNLTNLKCLGLCLYIEDLKNVMTRDMIYLEKVAIRFIIDVADLDPLNEFLQHLAESGVQLKHLSLDMSTGKFINNCLTSLHLFDLISLRIGFTYDNLNEKLPLMQPNIKHLTLAMGEFHWCYLDLIGDRLCPLIHQIISLIESLEKLETFRIIIHNDACLSLVLKQLQNNLLIREILGKCSTKRRPLRLYIKHRGDYWDSPEYWPGRLDDVDCWSAFLEVKVNLNDDEYI